MKTKVASLVVAAGKGTRAGGRVTKQFARLGDRTVLSHGLGRLLAEPRICGIRVVIAERDDADYARALPTYIADDPRLLAPVHGGSDRQASVLAGLRALKDLAPDIVLIHDGARPFPSPQLIGRVIDATGPGQGAVPALPVVDTIKRDRAGFAGQTIERSGLSRVQTPQGFPFLTILHAHETALATGKTGNTDDAAIAMESDLPVAFVTGDEDNMKITTPGDMERAYRQLAAHNLVPRTGLGFDVHAFEPGDTIVLCGHRIPYDRKLKGHSDADVALHALTDAIYGALAEGDIGSHFPPSQAQWKDVESSVFLTHAMARVKARRGRLVHVDLTIICEGPKIGPHRPAMVALMAGWLDLAPDAISIKATTTERLGFTGRGEGIAAQAVVTVLLPESADASR